MSADLPQYGAPPPGYQPPGYPPPGYQPGPPGFDIGKAFGWAWQKFRANTTVLVLGALVLLVLGIGVYVGAALLAHSVTGGSPFLRTDAETGEPTDIGGLFAYM